MNTLIPQHRREYDLMVVYRIYPRISKEPFVYPSDKFKLSELCLRSFRESLGDLRVKMHVLLDTCPQEYEELFRRYFSEENLHFERLHMAGNEMTYRRQLEILTQQTDSEYVYLAEDDYLYVPDQFPEMIRFMKSHDDVDFISPFDHLDYYTLALHKHKNEIRTAGRRHWRTANSTTLTFLTTRKVLKEAKQILTTFATGNWDASIFLSLTKKNLVSPRHYLEYTRQAVHGDAFMLKIMGKTWIYGWKQILLRRRFKLWVPTPAIATHLQYNTLAPAVDWLEVIRKMGVELGPEDVLGSENAVAK
jgi:hypothetical protein